MKEVGIGDMLGLVPTAHTHSLFLGHVGDGPLVLESQHRDLPHLLLLGLSEDLAMPLLGHRGDHLLLKQFVLLLLHFDCVVVLPLDLRFTHLQLVRLVSVCVCVCVVCLTHFQALWVFLEFHDVLLSHLPLRLLAVGQLIVPLRGVLLGQVVHPDLVQ